MGTSNTGKKADELIAKKFYQRYETYLKTYQSVIDALDKRYGKGQGFSNIASVDFYTVERPRQDTL